MRSASHRVYRAAPTLYSCLASQRTNQQGQFECVHAMKMLSLYMLLHTRFTNQRPCAGVFGIARMIARSRGCVQFACVRAVRIMRNLFVAVAYFVAFARLLAQIMKL